MVQTCSSCDEWILPLIWSCFSLDSTRIQKEGLCPLCFFLPHSPSNCQIFTTYKSSISSNKQLHVMSNSLDTHAATVIASMKQQDEAALSVMTNQDWLRLGGRYGITQESFTPTFHLPNKDELATMTRQSKLGYGEPKDVQAIYNALTEGMPSAATLGVNSELNEHVRRRKRDIAKHFGSFKVIIQCIPLLIADSLPDRTSDV
jgi:hypothetical protein